MSALRFSVSSGESAAASGGKTFAAVASPSNQRVKILGMTVFGKGTSNTQAPVKVELIVAASISGGTAGTVTTSKQDGDLGETVQSSVTGNYSAEPTYGTAVTVQTWEVHPQYGMAVWFPLGQEIILKGGTVFAVRITDANGNTMALNVYCEE